MIDDGVPLLTTRGRRVRVVVEPGALAVDLRGDGDADLRVEPVVELGPDDRVPVGSVRLLGSRVSKAARRSSSRPKFWWSRTGHRLVGRGEARSLIDSGQRAGALDQPSPHTGWARWAAPRRADREALRHAAEPGPASLREDVPQPMGARAPVPQLGAVLRPSRAPAGGGWPPPSRPPR